MPPIRGPKRNITQQLSAMTERKSTLRCRRPNPSTAAPEEPLMAFDIYDFDLTLETLPEREWVPKHIHHGLYTGQMIIDDPNKTPNGAIPASDDRPGAWQCTKPHAWEQVWNSSSRSSCGVCGADKCRMTERIADWDTPDTGFATYEGLSYYAPWANVGRLSTREAGKRISQRQARMRHLLEREFPNITAHDLRQYWLRYYTWANKDDFVKAWVRLGEEKVRGQLPDDRTYGAEQSEEHASMLDAEGEEEEEEKEDDRSSFQDDDQEDDDQSSSQTEQANGEELADRVDELLLITWDEVHTKEAKLRQIRRLRELYGHDARLLRDQVKRHAGAGLYL